jgi:hypothetical protein
MVTILLFAILAYFLYSLAQAILSPNLQNPDNLFFLGLMALFGLVVGLLSVNQFRRRMALAASMAAPTVMSVVLCSNCGFKIVRSFTAGDYIPKETGGCQQCNIGKMHIDLIYAEEQKKK